MKKYVLILLLLIAIGLGLAVQLLTTQDQQLNETVFLQTTESIRNLQAQDKNLSLLLNESRYNSQFDNTILTDTYYEIIEEFDNLRYDALFEEIEANPSLSRVVARFEQESVNKLEELEVYVENNSYVTDSLVTISEVTQPILEINFSDQTSFVSNLIGKTNAAVYQLTLGRELDAQTSSLLTDSFANQIDLINYEPDTFASELLQDYKGAIGDLVNYNDLSTQQFSALVSSNSSSLIDDIENEYTLSHNQAISKSTQFRNILIIYGLGLLTTLLFFGYKIRQNYSSLELQVAERTDEIKTAYEDLKESQEQLIQSEKMASLGQMVAGVAHEINTPLGYVTSNVDLLKQNITDLSQIISDLGTVNDAVRKPKRDNTEITKKLMQSLKTYKNAEGPELIQESTQLLTDGLYGLNEISKLVLGLKDFSRLDRQTTEQVNINDCIESSLTIASNHITENNVHINKQFNDLPSIACFPSKLNQLFLNIVTNACQAMTEKGGELVIKTEQQGSNIVIHFNDNGIGMDEKTQQHIFDPFFTSKEVGEGTGLGMSIAYKIIQAHKGEINISSELNKGTNISIQLPISND